MSVTLKRGFANTNNTDTHTGPLNLAWSEAARAASIAARRGKGGGKGGRGGIMRTKKSKGMSSGERARDLAEAEGVLDRIEKTPAAKKLKLQRIRTDRLKRRKGLVREAKANEREVDRRADMGMDPDHARSRIGNEQGIEGDLLMVRGRNTGRKFASPTAHAKRATKKGFAGKKKAYSPPEDPKYGGVDPELVGPKIIARNLERLRGTQVMSEMKMRVSSGEDKLKLRRKRLARQGKILRKLKRAGTSVGPRHVTDIHNKYAEFKARLKGSGRL